jgi:hypothetical protein
VDAEFNSGHLVSCYLCPRIFLLRPAAGVSFGHSVEGTQTWRRPNRT